MSEDKNKHLFFSLVYSFQMQAMIQLGKLANPVTGKAERELDAAQVTIDMLDMLKEKTGQNLAEDESRFLNQVTADLKLNFVEEKSLEGKSKTEPSDNSAADASGEIPDEKKETDEKEK